MAQALTPAFAAPPGNRSQTALKTYSFQEVWTLILEHQRARTSHFSPELVACLMWEESGFRLVENPRSHAMGFGQVLPSTLTEINKRYKTHFTRAELTRSPGASVQTTLMALELMWGWKRAKTDALLAYAGGFRNFTSVRRWLGGEPKMLEANWTHASTVPLMRANAAQQIIAGLKLCSQPGFDPQVLFSPTEK